MTPPLQRSTVPSTSPLGGDRPPLTPTVEPILGAGQEQGTEQEQQTPAVPESGSPEAPKWTTLERKEARLRADQIADLAVLRRHVGGRRKDRSEIITDNTLIRIAVDLLFAHAHRLHGDNEEELLNSVLPRRTRTARAAESSSAAIREG